MKAPCSCRLGLIKTSPTASSVIHPACSTSPTVTSGRGALADANLRQVWRQGRRPIRLHGLVRGVRKDYADPSTQPSGLTTSPCYGAGPVAMGFCRFLETPPTPQRCGNTKAGFVVAWCLGRRESRRAKDTGRSAGARDKMFRRFYRSRTCQSLDRRGTPGFLAFPRSQSTDSMWSKHCLVRRRAGRPECSSRDRRAVPRSEPLLFEASRLLAIIEANHGTRKFLKYSSSLHAIQALAASVRSAIRPAVGFNGIGGMAASSLRLKEAESSICLTISRGTRARQPAVGVTS